jgi:hypothetical protein
VKAFPPPDENLLTVGRKAWLRMFDRQDGQNPVIPFANDPLTHFLNFTKGLGTSAIIPFALWALRVLKAPITTVFTESKFSTLTATKSKHRGALSDESLMIPFVLQGRPPVAEVDFHHLLTQLNQQGSKVARSVLTGRRKKRAAPKAQRLMVNSTIRIIILRMLAVYWRV